MMRILYICLLLFVGSVGAQKSSLSQSVNQARSQGKVLSAKTKNGQHIVKVLTPDGRIKTIKNTANSQKHSRSQQDHSKGQKNKSKGRHSTNKSSRKQHGSKNKNNNRKRASRNTSSRQFNSRTQNRGRNSAGKSGVKSRDGGGKKRN